MRKEFWATPQTRRTALLKALPFDAETQLSSHRRRMQRLKACQKEEECFSVRSHEGGNSPGAIMAGILAKKSQKGFATALLSFAAAYVRYCKVFVTNDEGQRKAPRTVTELMGFRVSVVMYDDFKRQLFGLNS